jgi:hypothetical protein
LQGFHRGLPSLPRRRSLLRPDRLELASGRLGAHELVLSRGLCRFGRFELGHIPPAKRSAALRLTLPTWAPFHDPDSVVAWADGIATVWCWDRKQVQALLQQQGYAGKPFAFILPESLLKPPQRDGLRLVQTLDGVEAQHWRTGHLLASRWWPRSPDDTAWQAFQRDCGIEPDLQQALPAAQAIEWLPRPWAQVEASGLADSRVALWEQAVHLALLAAVAVALTAMTLREVQLAHALQDGQNQLDEFKRLSAPLLKAREDALAALARMSQIDGLQRYPSPLSMMAAIAQALPEQGATLREWEMADGKLKLLVGTTGASLTGADVVAALEKTRLFSGVKVVTQADPRQIGFVMDLRSLRELETGVRQATP